MITLIAAAVACLVEVMVSMIFQTLSAPTIEEALKHAASLEKSSSVVPQVELDDRKRETQKLRAFSSTTIFDSQMLESSNRAYSSMRSRVGDAEAPIGRPNNDDTNVANPDTAITTRMDLFTDCERLLGEVRQHERRLRGRELQRFQSQWPPHLTSPNPLMREAVRQLSEELQDVGNEALSWIEKLKGRDDAFIGVKILELLIIDLVGRGTPSAKIFANQVIAAQDRTVVTWSVKALIVSAVM